MAQLADKLKALGEKARSMEGKLETEEATKNALVMPFIAALGYDVFDPSEVIPEFTADVGVKRGEKVDYAIKNGDRIVMLIEAKKAGAQLSIENASQLYRYFSVTDARIAVLTNGVRYRFFSDIEESNKMDSVPFLDLDLYELREGVASELEHLTKQDFHLDDALTSASNLKYMRVILQTFERQFEEPDEELVKFFFSRANPTGRFGQSSKEQFTKLVRAALHQVISDRVSSRFRSTIGQSVEESPATPEAPEEQAPADGIVTTQEELDAFSVVKAIVCSTIPAARIFPRDTKSYFGVLLDDNNRKPICRLHFNRSQKYIGLFDEQRKETRHAIETIDDIYKFADELRAIVSRYEEVPQESGRTDEVSEVEQEAAG